MIILGDKLFEKSYPSHRSSFEVGGYKIGEDFAFIAGPCAVEDKESLIELAKELSGADIIRGGVFKSRTSPYSFTGLGERALQFLEIVSNQQGKPIIVEFIEPEQIRQCADAVDMIQIGTRNMFNYPLLQQAARTGKPILLKRHFSATLDEFLYAAEYILEQGNAKLALCERGIRTFETKYRNCLDLTGMVLLKQLTHLPVLVDPSHAAGDSSIIESLACAAVAAGADGLILEVHNNPICSRSDAPQALTPYQFHRLQTRVRKLLGFRQ